MRRKSIKIKKLYEILKKQVDKGNGDCIIEFYLELPNKDCLDLSEHFSIGQFQVIPDMTFTFKLAEYEKEKIKIVE
jgi:hypothetical protein